MYNGVSFINTENYVTSEVNNTAFVYVRSMTNISATAADAQNILLLERMT